MAEEQVRRWTVTYTKHVKQKRKVYQDGYLLLPSKNKVMLYDDCDKFLDSKFLKEDESLISGGALTFGSYLVDIGEADSAELAQEEKSKKNSGSDRNCTPGRQKTSAINISPSRRIIREFKKNEKFKSALQERSPISTTSIAGEWQAMYTTNLTQKAKKYHDGFIKLVLCGSQGRQAKLYDESKTLLDSRFLRKDQIISSGESLKFDGYLIDIGDPVNHEKLVEVKAEEPNLNTSEEQRTIGRNQFQRSSFKNGVSGLRSRKLSQSYVSAYQLFKKGNPSHDASSEKHVEQRMNSSGIDADRAASTENSVPNMSLRCGNTPRNASPAKDVEQSLNSGGIDAGRVRLTESRAPNTPFRGANEILSFLKKPTSPRSTSITEQAPPENQSFPSPDLVTLDADYKERSEASAQRNFNELREQGTQKSEDKVAEYDGLTQTNSTTDKGEEPGVNPFDISRKIKIEKDCDNISIQHGSSSARSVDRPTSSCHGLMNTACSTEHVVSSPPLIDPEKLQTEEFMAFKGISNDSDFSFSSNTQSGLSHDKRSEVGEDPKSVNRAFGMNHPFKMNSTKIRRSSTKMDDCPSFDLGF